MNEFRSQAEAFGLTVLSVEIPPTSKAMESVIDVIARAAKCPSFMEKDLFGSLPACLREKGIRIIVLEGASHLSDTGIREMARLCLSSSDGQPMPPIIWHAKPGWEMAYRPDAPPCALFLGSIPMPVVESALPIETIRLAFPCLGGILNPANDSLWNRVIDATNGELGSLLILENDFAQIASARENQSAVDKTEMLARLSDMLFGKRREIVAKKPPPRRSGSAENLASVNGLPGVSIIAAPPLP